MSTPSGADPTRGARRYGPSSAQPQPPRRQGPAAQHDPGPQQSREAPQSRAPAPHEPQRPAGPQPQRPDLPPAAAQQPPRQGRPSPSAQAWGELDRPATPSTRMMPAAPPPAPRPMGPGGPVDREPPHHITGGPGSGDGGDDGDGRRRTPGGLLASRIVSAVAATAVLLAAGLGFFLNVSGNSDAIADARQNPTINIPGQNILLIGSDSRTNADGTPLSAEELQQVATEASNGVNTDTMMIVHIPEGGGRATAVSLPRDTWIDQTVVTDLPGPYSDGSTGDYKPNKINAFYGTAKAFSQEALAQEGVDGAERERRSSEAGRTMLIQVISRFTGLRIDHFAEVNLIAFYTISNAIGGVPVCLTEAVDDPMSGAKFAAGPQEISGTAALSFVRQRHGLPAGDLDRVRRQQAFLSGAIRKVTGNPGAVPGLVGAAEKSLVMDQGFDLLSLGQQMARLSSGDVTFQTLPTHGPAEGVGTDALATDPAEVAAFFSGLASTTTATSGSAATTTARARTTIDVQNGTMVAGRGQTVADLLTGGGLLVSDPADMPGKSQSNQLVTTEIRYPAGGEAAAAKVQSVLGFGEPTPNDDVRTGHVLVVAGNDAPSPGQGLRGAGTALQPVPVGLQPVPAQAPTTSSDAPAAADGIPCIN